MSSLVSLEQQDENDEIVFQYNEFLTFLKTSPLTGMESYYFYGYSLIAHVGSGIIPQLTLRSSYLSNLRKTVNEE